MEEPRSSSRMIPVDHDLADFEERAARHNASDTPAKLLNASIRQDVRRALSRGFFPSSRLPRRFLLHLLLLAFVPLSFAGNAAQSAAGEVAALNETGKAALWQHEQRPFTLALAEPDEASISTLSSDQARRASSGSGDLPGPVMLSTRNDTSLNLPGRGVAAHLPESSPAAPAAPGGEQQPVSASQEPTAAPEPEQAAAPEATPTPEAAPAPEGPPTFIGQVTVELANLRGGPGTDYEKVGALAVDDAITALARYDDWLVVQTLEGQEAWISAELIDLPPELIDSLPAAEHVPDPPPPLVATVTDNKLNLRDGPSTDYVPMAKLMAGDQIDLLARYGEWYQILAADGTSGWVTGEYLSMAAGVHERVPEADSAPPANPTLVGWVTDNNVNLRGGPSTKYNSLGKMDAGTELKLVARHDSWYSVVTARGTQGWVFGDLVDVSPFIKRRVASTNDIPALPKPKPKAKPKPRRSAPVNVAASGDVASLAWRYVGYRYVWGGESPNVGFDCSGLTKYVYGLVGVGLPHNARAQFSTRYGAVINDMGSLQPGDLMFFVNTAGPGISHVGIYVGGGQIVHATTPRTGVIVSNVWDSYWVRHFYAAIRPYR